MSPSIRARRKISLIAVRMNYDVHGQPEGSGADLSAPGLLDLHTGLDHGERTDDDLVPLAE